MSHYIYLIACFLIVASHVDAHTLSPLRFVLRSVLACIKQP